MEFFFSWNFLIYNFSDVGKRNYLVQKLVQILLKYVYHHTLEEVSLKRAVSHKLSPRYIFLILNRKNQNYI